MTREPSAIRTKITSDEIGEVKGVDVAIEIAGTHEAVRRVVDTHDRSPSDLLNGVEIIGPKQVVVLYHHRVRHESEDYLLLASYDPQMAKKPKLREVSVSDEKQSVYHLDVAQRVQVIFRHTVK